MLAIVGGKGGCGKTTTALGLARELARSGERPLVVDADCDMPNLHTMAGTDREPGVGAVENGASIDRTVHRSGAYPGVDVLPAGKASVSLGANALQRLSRRAERVIVDCPAGAADAVAAPLRAADDALIVSTAVRESLEDAAKTARIAESLDCRVLGGVVTRVDDDASPAAASGGPLGEHCRILATVPAVPGDVLESRVGRASYERLATAVAGRNI
jgi:septum site-determining protein MinD